MCKLPKIITEIKRIKFGQDTANYKILPVFNKYFNLFLIVVCFVFLNNKVV